MPKPMSISIEVEEVAFGKVFRTLDGMPGVININIRGKGPKPNGSAPILPVSARKGNGKTVHTLILESLLASKSPKSREELGEAVATGGKSATSTPDGLQKLKKQKLIKQAGVGKYRITAAGIRAATTNTEQ